MSFFVDYSILGIGGCVLEPKGDLRGASSPFCQNQFNSSTEFFHFGSHNITKITYEVTVAAHLWSTIHTLRNSDIKNWAITLLQRHFFIFSEQCFKLRNVLIELMPVSHIQSSKSVHTTHEYFIIITVNTVIGLDIFLQSRIYQQV